MPVDTVISRPTPRPGILGITPYKGGDAGAPGPITPVKLSSNENCLGCSPAALAAFRAQDALEIYPEGSAAQLRAALADAHDLEADRIVCGAGSDEILQLLARAYAGPGDEIVYSEHGFLVYRLAAQQVGAAPVPAPERALTSDVDALLGLVTERTRLVYIANPNNPTGTYLSSDEMARLHAGLPSDVLLVIDGAYAEYVRRGDYDGGFALARTAENVVATRTFSKIHGLAALRLGWAYGPAHVMDVLNRVRGPFNVSSAAMAAGEAALADADFAKRSADHNETELAFLAEGCRALGLLATESVCNFVLLRFPDEDGRRAADADAHLRARGLIVRRMDAYGLPDCLRVTVGLHEHNVAVLEALRALMEPA